MKISLNTLVKKLQKKSQTPATSSGNILYHTSFLDLKETLFNKSPWYYAHRPNTSGCVTLIPIRRHKKNIQILLIETIRPPIQAENISERCIEWPAGLIGDERKGESVEEAIRAELLEETGYSATHIDILATRVASSPGATSETTTVALCHIDSNPTSSPTNDNGVILKQYWIDLDHVFDFLKEKEKRGFVVSAIVYGGLGLISQKAVYSKISLL